MRKTLLTLGFLLGLSAPAWAQVPCIGVGGVNSVPQVGVTCGQEPAINSYAATGLGIVPASAATDIACITGNATTVTRVQNIRVSGTGTAISIPIVITKHASANTLGTPATGTALPVPYKLDSTDIAPLATTTAYTANPTINDATPGIIDVSSLGLAATTATNSATINFDYDDRNYIEAPTLRGVAQQVCVNLNGTSPTALLNVTFKWTESPQ